MRPGTVLRCLLCWLLWGASPVLWAHSLSVVDVGEQKRIELDAQLSVLKDPSSRMTIDQVAGKEGESRWRRANLKALTPGYTRDATWVSVGLHNATAVTQARFLEISPSRLRSVHLYMSGQEGWAALVSGTNIPIDERLVVSRRVVFPIELAPGEQRNVFIRVQSGNAVMIAARLWQKEEFYADSQKIDLVNGLQFGAIFLFSIYSLLWFIGSRNRVFFHLFIAMTAYGFFDVAIHQYGLEFLWAGRAEWNMRSPGFFLAIAGAASALLVSHLLQLRRYSFWQERAMMFLAGVLLLIAFLQLILPYSQVVPVTNVLVMATVLLSLLMTALSAWRRQRNAGWMLFAFVLLWFISLLRIAQIFGWLPYSLFGGYAQSWSMVLSGAVLAGVSLDIVRQLRLDRARSREMLLASREQSALRLEQEVAARTEALHAAKIKAEEESQAKSTFLAHMSHELRTPLHSILGYSQLAMENARSPENPKRMEAVHRRGRHLLALIDELLDYARGEAGRLQLERRPAYFQSLLESAIEEVMPLAKEARAEVQGVFGPALPPAVHVDAVRLQQVLTNLLANACRHSQGELISLEVRLIKENVGADPGSAALWFGVRDNGMGIPEAERQRVFSPFEQVEATTSSRGVGLGLTIAHQLVTLMGGKLVCEANEGGGSLFWFQVVLERADESELVPVSGLLGLYRYEGPVRRIMVVDDSVETRAVLTDILASSGFDLAVVTSGEEALMRLMTEPVDAVLIDQFVTDLSHEHLLRRARAHGLMLPFLLLSATRPGVPEDGVGQPLFTAVLIKPVRPERLLKTLGKVLALAWGADATSPRQVSVKPPQQWVRPTPEQLESLRRAVELGQVTEVEEWIVQLRKSQPDASEFAQLVQDAIRRLDFAFILRLLNE
jgi:signal transduction histidine kinase/DNA-binding NarL/FixJ family response regulator